jgi:hypothetical protein
VGQPVVVPQPLFHLAFEHAGREGDDGSAAGSFTRHGER